MSSGKLAAQAGHAFSDALVNSMESHPEYYQRYRDGVNGGSKVALYCKNEGQLIRAYNEARAAGLPCSIIVDQNHVMPPHFDGSPVITAMAIGPCTKEECRQITKRFNCVK